ncbi:hypothetical protein AMK59_8394 [Oryctes borbonicus]|uniref:TGF-beta family profile domain-containing protein n=1 Tax=Oryctes borbonicus TaxID=1629725 RepID=A0A0T6AZ31_9SCAR|nr:hypothetical protein AMK59_8394 [Oryctes borbonicus]
MGDQFWTHITVWTYLCLVCIIIVCGSEDNLFEDLGLEVYPDIRKINISQEEYTRMMRIYLDNLKNESKNTESIPDLLTFKSERKSWRRRRLYFPIKQAQSEVTVDSSELRLLAPAIPNTDLLNISIYQILNRRRKRFITEKTVYPSPIEPKWWDFDLTSATSSWMSGERNLGIEIDCLGCGQDFHPLEASINALVLPKNHQRSKRGIERTDCRSNDPKRKCCRHKLQVDFKKLKLGEMDSIIQPKTYEAGYCRGRCPLNYNYATNHSRIQSIVHRMNKTVPRVCCAPSKLTHLEILRVDPHDYTKLHVEKWDNMVVLECACS